MSKVYDHEKAQRAADAVRVWAKEFCGVILDDPRPRDTDPVTGAKITPQSAPTLAQIIGKEFAEEYGTLDELIERTIGKETQNDPQ